MRLVQYLQQLYASALVKKAIMAVTGIALFGFVFVHMTGNLKIFQGPEKFDGYAEFLRTFGQPILPYSGMVWILRTGLLVAVLLHILAATQLTLMNRRARPIKYKGRKSVQMDYASRTMRYSGYLIFGYIIYHLMHFTIGNVHSDFIEHAPYHNVICRVFEPDHRWRLHRDQHPAWVSPVPRPLEPLSDARAEPSTLECSSARLCGHLRCGRDSRLRCRAGRSADGSGLMRSRLSPFREIASTSTAVNTIVGRKRTMSSDSQTLDSKTPEGPIENRWTDYRNQLKLVAPNNRRKFDVIVVGSGLAGASCAATLGEAGYNVTCFLFSGQPTSRSFDRSPGWNQRR